MLAMASISGRSHLNRAKSADIRFFSYKILSESVTVSQHGRQEREMKDEQSRDMARSAEYVVPITFDSARSDTA